MGMAAILFMWPGSFEQLSFPHPTEAPYEILLWKAQWFLRRICLKSVGDDDDGWMTEAYLFYKLTNEPSPQVSY